MQVGIVVHIFFLQFFKQSDWFSLSKKKHHLTRLHPWQQLPHPDGRRVPLAVRRLRALRPRHVHPLRADALQPVLLVTVPCQISARCFGLVGTAPCTLLQYSAADNISMSLIRYSCDSLNETIWREEEKITGGGCVIQIVFANPTTAERKNRQEKKRSGTGGSAALLCCSAVECLPSSNCSRLLENKPRRLSQVSWVKFWLADHCTTLCWS